MNKAVSLLAISVLALGTLFAGNMHTKADIVSAGKDTITYIQYRMYAIYRIFCLPDRQRKTLPASHMI